MNKNLLRSIMIRHGDTNSELAKLLNISEQSVSAKLNENKSEFKQSEIAKISERYNLSPEDIKLIFFD